MLEQKLEIIQQQIALKFQQIRQEHQHSGNKGANVEKIVREFLREFLPPLNRVGEGAVIDTNGQVSAQTDVVITNPYHPYLNELTKPEIFFIEGVMCVGEVKSVLTSTDLTSVLENCVKFKSLHIKISNGTLTHTTPSDRVRFADHRAFFLFAFESQIKLETVLERIHKYNAEKQLSTTSQIDGVFILDRGYAINFGDGKGALRFIDAQSEESVPGLVNVSKGNVLFHFLSWISTVDPRLIVFEPVLVPYLFGDKSSGKAT